MRIIFDSLLVLLADVFPLNSWVRILAATGSVSFSPSTIGAPAPTIDPTKEKVTFLPSNGTAPLSANYLLSQTAKSFLAPTSESS